MVGGALKWPHRGLRRAAAQGDIDLDLGSAIGSRRWWMKLVACTALVGGAMLAASIVPPLYEAAPAPLTPAPPILFANRPL